jgi:hypothetical protein
MVVALDRRDSLSDEHLLTNRDTACLAVVVRVQRHAVLGSSPGLDRRR